MVGEDNGSMAGSLYIVSPFFKGSDDGKQFSVVDIIVPFCRRESFGVESYRMSVSV